jgi:G3E family GTPase
VRGDLIRIIGGLMKRKGGFDGMIIETTGLADPAPVAQTFFVDADVRTATRLDAIVTVVDAKHFLTRVNDSHEAEEQVAFADVILLNKADLVTQDELDAVARRLHTINRFAEIHQTKNCDVTLAKILDRGAFDLQRILTIEPAFLSDDEHEHDSTVTSLSFTSDRLVDPNRFSPWIQDVLRRNGIDIFRSKGILAVENAARCLVFQGVHMLVDTSWGRAWRPEEPRRSKIVFIGRNLDSEKLRRGFEACLI